MNLSQFKVLLFALFMLAICREGYAQDDEEYSLSGYIRDGETGEELIQATLYIQSLDIGITSNVYGYYSLSIPTGQHKARISYLGFNDKIIDINLSADLTLNIDLTPSSNLMDEVVITSEVKTDNVTDVKMSQIDVDIAAVKKMPALFGEVDIIKAIQLMPGVKTVGEGTSGFFVRGGNSDQNLILLDEAPIYNASHLLGFFSSFNPDAIKDMQMYKGAISSKYGGRLSSVLDIRMKEGNSKKIRANAGVGLIMSRLAVEAPISDKGSVILSGRRSYLDVIAKLVTKQDSASKNNKFYFYDLNAKANYRFGEKDRVFISGYLGRDVISQASEGFDVGWGNKTFTARWNHLFNPKLFSNLTFYYSNYDYGLGIKNFSQNVNWDAGLKEFSAKLDLTSYLNNNHSISYGAQAILHNLQPGQIIVSENDIILTNFKVDQSKSLESAIYITDEWKINSKWNAEIGLRVSALSNIGPVDQLMINSEYQVTDTIKRAKGIYHTSVNFEPRIGLRYGISDDKSIKASYNRMTQYIQQASNGNSATPFDIWFTASPNIKPQISDQYAIGYFQNLFNNSVEFSAEVYYKKFTNAIDFRERAQLLLNKELEKEIRSGEGRAYGIEFLLKKSSGRLSGWIGYTLSKVEKKIDQVNENNWYNAKYDKPHDLSIVASYDLSKQWSVSSNFVYSTGSAVTFPTGKYVFEGTFVPVYSERNGERLPDFHRMDCSATWKPKKKLFKVLDTELIFSIYNVYNKKNAFAINFKQDEQIPNKTYAEKVSVFSIVPSFTFNAQF